ncbi:MAG: proprotein convertase P-domain-containing protein, partial [Verrucomicrobiota bacterium]
GIQLFLRVQNDSTNNSTGVSGVLSSLNGTVTVTGNNSTFPNIAGGATDDNNTAYVINIDPSHPCGSPINLRLTMNSDQGGNTVDISLPTGSVGAPVNRSFSGLNVPIDDFVNFSLNFPISDMGIIGDVNFSFDGTVCSTDPGSTLVGLNHNYIGDVTVTLISPTGTEVILVDQLSNGGGGNSGHNFCQTVLDDNGPANLIQNVTSVDAPFTGTFRPANPLSAFDGEQANGTWTLRLFDGVSGDTGQLNSFTLSLAFISCAPPNSNVMHTITATVDPQGIISPSGMVMVANGGNQNFMVEADNYYHINQILTNGSPIGMMFGPGVSMHTYMWNNITANGTIHATFGENLATNNVPEWWLAMFGFTSNFDAAALADQDNDGVGTWEEFVAGTDPTDNQSVLEADVSGNVITWSSEAGKLYNLRRSTNLINDTGIILQMNIPATPPMNTYTDSVMNLDQRYYQVEVLR